MTDHPSTVPPFTIPGATFVCWIVDDGPNEAGIPGQRYVWRSTCGRYAVGRRVRTYWARRDGRVVGANFLTSKLAMIAAVSGARREAA
jgi:hypothetical protein